MSRGLLTSVVAILAAVCGVTVWEQVEMVGLRRQLARQSDLLEAAARRSADLERRLAAAQGAGHQLGGRFALAGAAGRIARVDALFGDLDHDFSDARDAAHEEGIADGTAEMNRAIAAASADTVQRLAGLIGSAMADRLFVLEVESNRWAQVPAAAPAPAQPPSQTTVVVNVAPQAVAQPVAVPVPVPVPEVETSASEEEAPAGAPVAIWPAPVFYSAPAAPFRERPGHRPIARRFATSPAAVRFFAASAGIPLSTSMR